MRYFVPLIPQLSSMGCWAASIAMVQSWAGQTSVDPGTIAARDGYQAKLSTGLAPADGETPTSRAGSPGTFLERYAEALSSRGRWHPIQAQNEYTGVLISPS
jgi:hypothetical protein